ncbi:MAG: NTP transferase domain-containing protein [Promethearchaeota archaeon]
MESVILAAGYSSRFNFEDNSYRKYLLPFERSNILNYVIVSMFKAGIFRINIIIDDKTEKALIIDSCTQFFDKINLEHQKLSLNFIRNSYSERENGYSLFLGAKEVFSDFFILSMADHIFSVNVYEILIKNYNKEDVILATDPMKIKGVYDLDDCTKVLGSNLEIKKIGKRIPYYNRLDMGVFIMKTSSIQKISQDVERKKNKFGVSDIVISAIDLNLKISYLDFPETIWLDVDNHIEYEKLKKIFNKSSKYSPFNLDILINDPPFKRS